MILLSSLLACSCLCSPLADAPAQLDIRIPVVDMNDYASLDKREQFLDTLENAMRTVGFFAVRNTGVDRDLIHAAYAQSQLFFKQDLSEKMESFSPTIKGQRGFVPGETAKGGGQKDYKEFYHIGRELSLEELREWGLVQNIWPKSPEFRTHMTHLYSELETHVHTLFEAILATINRHTEHPIPTDFFDQITDHGDSLLRALYYPALSEDRLAGSPVYWAAPHTDIDLLAILPYATEKGLQVEIDGQWLTVVVPEDAFVVNVGDMLENLTNGLFTSARHRVKALEPGKDRFSMVLFVHPRSDTPIGPLPTCIELTGGVQTYAPGTRLEFLLERLLELGIAPDALVPYSKMGHTERQMLYGRASPQVVELLLKNNLASDELREMLK